jgi:transposase InsO family protein
MSNNDSFVPLPEPTVPQEPAALPEDPGGLASLPLESDLRAEAARPAEEGPPPVEPLPGLAGGGMAARRRRQQRGKRLVLPGEKPPALTAEQRLLLLDTWQRSGLPAGDFAALVGLSKHTLYAWKKRFDQQGPGGLLDKPKGGPKGSHLPDLTKRTILLLKQSHPDWGCQKISDMLLRGPALPASASAVARVLHEHGYQLEEVPSRPHPDRVRHFERARPNQLWQTDLFTFMLKRQNRRVYLVAFMDDHSRFIVGYGLHASQSTALVLEVLGAALTSYGPPEEVLTDNGSQYVTWRGKSSFTKELEKRGIKQLVAAPRRPQTLGKIERFWGTMWRECIEGAVFVDLGDAQRRIGLFIDYYNLQRPHQGIDGLVPADRFFGAAPEVLRTLRERVAANALELARHGRPTSPFYLTGQVGNQPFSVHAEGERVILTANQGRQEIDLVPPAPPSAVAELPEPLCPAGVVLSATGPEQAGEPAPGTSVLDPGRSGDAQAPTTAPGGEP